jgi:hypothetical protein
MKVTVFWNVAPCSIAEIALLMEAINISETSVNFYETTRRNILEDSHVHLQLINTLVVELKARH